ncbi:formyltransferase family protein [Porticoccaceae bacterium]|nr:formyltransferase family protein [Porticoccaceae bacterium]
MEKKIRVAVLTQEDSFVIPENIKLLDNQESIELVAVVKIDGAGTLENKKTLFIKGFGLIQVGRMGLVLIFNQILNITDALFLFKLGFLKSLKSVAVACDSKYKVVIDPNDKTNIDWLAELNIDLVVSFSAPCVFKNELLKLPKLGCINLHCSLLPKYAGLLPSFWALYEKADMFGATVHQMDDKIDNGAILGQVEISRPSELSMFNVIKATKRAGGHLMVSVISEILSENSKVQSNRVESKDYYSWPTIEHIKEFRRNGGRLI